MSGQEFVWITIYFWEVEKVSESEKESKSVEERLFPVPVSSFVSVISKSQCGDRLPDLFLMDRN